MAVKSYFWRARPNFGDRLTPLLLRRFAHLDAVWAPPEEAELFGVGSILEQVPAGYTGIIAGSGKLHEATKPNFADARVLALRGPLSARGLKGDFVLGDPGLLADELVQRPEPEYHLGLVPHWTDTALEHRREFLRYDPLIIRPGDDPLTVIESIGKCRKIVSSSLHAIVLADAFGIPRRIEMAPLMLSNPAREGGTFKWRDYHASLGVPFEVGVTQEVDYNRVFEKQHELWDVLWEIGAIFRAAQNQPAYSLRR